MTPDDDVSSTETDGSNWGGFGIYTRDYSKYEADMRDKFELE